MWINIKEYTDHIRISDILLELSDALLPLSNQYSQTGGKFLVTRGAPNLELTEIKQIKGNYILLGNMVLEKGNEAALRNGSWLIEIPPTV